MSPDTTAPLRQRKPKARVAKAAAVAKVTDAPIEGAWCVGITHVDRQGRLIVTSGGLRARATRAASCLLEPAKGDSVACLRIAPDEVWIMAILQREENVPNVLRCLGDTTFEVLGGGLHLKSSHVSLDSDALSVRAKQATATIDTVEAMSQSLNVVAAKIKVIGNVFSSVFERVQQFSKHYVRTTDGIDRVAATHVECEAKQLLRLEGENALINGRELIKARGAQIHFG